MVTFCHIRCEKGVEGEWKWLFLLLQGDLKSKKMRDEE